MGTTVGILAHVDAGKTTLAEQILYRSGTLRKAGRVDQRSAFLDYSPIERERGITVFSDQAEFTAGGRKFTLTDTPGHADFSGEMERCLWIMDCAVLVVSSVEGLQSHTHTVWGLLKKHRIPAFVFLNKTDRTGADPERIRKQLRDRYHIECPDFTGTFHEGIMDEPLAESLAGLDDSLMEEYFSSGYEPKKWLRTLRRLFRERAVFPVFTGSALNGDGVGGFLDALPRIAPESPGKTDAPFSARAYKVRHEKSGRVVFLKIDQGTLRPKELIRLPGNSGDPAPLEKAHELREYSGSSWKLIPEADPGDLCAVTGIRNLRPGDGVGEGAVHRNPFELKPVLSAKVLFDSALIPKTVLGHFRELEDEEPLLGVSWNEAAQEIEVRIMGEVQLEVLQELIRDRYGIEVRFGPCKILYQETIAQPSIGCGHFEPLRHYAEVHLRLAPGERGSGIVFDSECPLDDLSANWQNLVRTHVLEKQHKGVLTGSPLTDVRITLLAGRAHLKHTEGGDFREATYRAIRQGLMSNSGNVLLEPTYKFHIEAAYSLAGRVLSDIRKMNGTCGPPENAGDFAVLTGCAPVSKMRDYPRELVSLTKGAGRISLTPGSYEPCHNAEEVIAQAAYEPERDVENTPDSVFCSHGAGFPVKWRDAPAYMHIKR